MRKRKITNDYIRGLVDSGGCFTFCTAPRPDGSKVKIPAFILTMNERDSELVEVVRDHLGLKNNLNHAKAYKSDGYNRKGTVRLMVRDIGSHKNIIVPFFYKKLIGYKREQFDNWIEQMEKDPDVREDFKLIPKLYKNGFYDKNFLYD